MLYAGQQRSNDYDADRPFIAMFIEALTDHRFWMTPLQATLTSSY